MPHGLGSARDFGHEIEPEPQPERQGVLRDINAEIAAQMAEEEDLAFEEKGETEILGPTEEELQEAAEVEFLQELINQAGAGYGRAPQYYLSPMDVAAFVVHEIITVDEARNYLRDQGIDLRG